MLIKVPQGQAIEYPSEGTLKEILVQEDKTLLKQYIAARADDERVDFHTQLGSEAEIELIPWDADEAAGLDLPPQHVARVGAGGVAPLPGRTTGDWSSH